MPRILAFAVAPFVLALGLATLVTTQAAAPTPAAGACATPAASPMASPGTSPATAATTTPRASAPAAPMASPTATGCVTVSLREFAITMPNTLPAGPTTFTVTNAGTITHSFEIQGQGIEQRLAQPLQPGQSATLTVELKPGSYEAYCPVDGHKGMGMDRKVTVK